MNKEESLERFERGEDDWNTWANTMLTERKALESAGTWNEETRSWHERAKADFSGHNFTSGVDFSNFHFPGEVSFISVNFQGYVYFDSAKFHHEAHFGKVTFSKNCRFRNATFTKKAEFLMVEFSDFADFSNVVFKNEANFDSIKASDWSVFNSAEFKGIVSFQGASFFDRANFKDTKFKSNADFMEATFFRAALFNNAEFEGVALFLQCSFKGIVIFKESSFKNLAIFRAISGKGFFSLYNVKFSSLPDFTEAHFEEAPLFDDVELKPERFKKSRVHETKPNLPSRWRALRRLAIQAHDYERELQFFKGEIIARRCTEDKLKHARFWFGCLYQLLSDFGRSMGRPLLSLAISLLLFATIYAYQSPADWYQLLIEPASCIDGSGDRRIVALGISVVNAFPFAAISSSDLLNQFYTCLYGIQESAPVIPYLVTFVSVIQFFVSAVLLFLFLLAVRNHFRIK